MGESHYRGRNIEDVHGGNDGSREGGGKDVGRGVDEGNIITHRSKWAATSLFEPVFLTSEKCKETFAAQLVIDIVPSLGEN